MSLYKRINDFLWSRWWKYRVYFRRFPEEKPGYGLRNFVAKLFGFVRSSRWRQSRERMKPMDNKVVSWFSGGVSSFIAAYLVRDKLDEIFYIDIKDQHPDTMRFLHDCEKALGKEIKILKSDYGSVNEVIEKHRFINSPYGAKCTQILKKRVRQEWEMKQSGVMTYVWGYDCTERDRAERLQETMQEYEHTFPLIDAGLTKEEVHGMLWRLGIQRPEMYDMGYRNNNCIGCVKGGMGYWNKIRKDFPEVFAERAKLERKIGASCIKGVYLDELEPDRGNIEDEVMEECGIMCQLAYIESRAV